MGFTGMKLGEKAIPVVPQGSVVAEEYPDPSGFVARTGEYVDVINDNGQVKTFLVTRVKEGELFLTSVKKEGVKPLSERKNSRFQNYRE